MNHEKYNAVGKDDIAALERNGCQADDWSQVFVSSKFDPTRFHHVSFGGTIKLALQQGEIAVSGSRKKMWYLQRHATKR